MLNADNIYQIGNAAGVYDLDNCILWDGASTVLTRQAKQ